MKYKFAILKNELADSEKRWRVSCENLGVDYTVIDLTKHDWFEQVTSQNFDCFLLKPPGEIFRFKEVFDERVYIISEIMGKFAYPSYEELRLHENKRFLSFFLKGAKIPHPETDVFYYKDEAMQFAGNCKYPVVAKTSIGASGSGVKIIRTKSDAEKYISEAFGKGIKRRFGPNRNVGNVKSWSKKFFLDYKKAIKKIKKYFELYDDAQKGFVIFQEYIPHEYEWRLVKIGESYFGHQKIKNGDKASGTKGINYISPPVEMLDFVKELCSDNNFNCMAVDLFEAPDGRYVINELQTIFGHVQKYIMEVNGKIGRYIYDNGKWVFEEGDFNSNESYDLRLKHAIEMLDKF